MTKYDIKVFFPFFSFFYVYFPSSNSTRSPRAVTFTLKHTWTCLPCSALTCTLYAHMHTAQYSTYTKHAHPVTQKRHAIEKNWVGCRGRFFLPRRIIKGKELGADEDYLFCEESLLRRNWVKKKNFFFF
jgi:hypothetical protein